MHDLSLSVSRQTESLLRAFEGLLANAQALLSCSCSVSRWVRLSSFCSSPGSSGGSVAALLPYLLRMVCLFRAQQAASSPVLLIVLPVGSALARSLSTCMFAIS